MSSTLLRVILLSLGLSVAIKFGAPFLEIPTNNTTATIGVFLPVLLVALTLSWRHINKKSTDNL
jgi:membrane protein implicated in regulation of membrane protease activity